MPNYNYRSVKVLKILTAVQKIYAFLRVSYYSLLLVPGSFLPLILF